MCDICLAHPAEPGRNICGPCRRQETPESNPDLLEED